MNYIDIIILVFAIWFGIRGLMHGLIRELATIIALILAVWAVCLFQDTVIIWLGNIPAVTIIARILIFVIVLCSVHLVGKIIEKLVHLVLPSFINYVAGLFFGIAKALLIMSLLISLIIYIDTKEIIFTSQAKQSSIFYPHVEPIFPKCKTYFQK